MARVTVEDCITQVESRFDLVLLAAQRTRQICSGSPLTVERDNDKYPVIALREIAEGTLNIEELRHSSIQSYRHYQSHTDEKEEELENLLFDDKNKKSRNIEIGLSEIKDISSKS